MEKWPRYLAGLIVVGVVAVAAVAAARAETFDLELKRLEPVVTSQVYSGRLPADYFYRMARPQQFSMQIRPGQPADQARATAAQMSVRVLDGRAESTAASFGKIVKKEPASYKSEHPFRGVAKLGSGEYGFVVDLLLPEPEEPKAEEEGEEEEDADSDSAEAKPESEAPEVETYCALHFDVNGNGDLTDDKVIQGKVRENVPVRTGYQYFQFPRVDLAIEIDGAKSDYAFFFTVYSRFIQSRSSGFFSVEAETTAPRKQTVQRIRYISAMLQAAAYREGEIELDGNTKSVVLLDFNSNGRFDDKMGVRESSSGRASPTYGDLLMLDLDPSKQTSMSSSDLMENQVTKLASIDGDLYDLGITPGGDKLTLTRSSVGIGQVSLPCDGFQGMVYGENGVLRISGDQSEPVSIPSGDWKLMSYTIDRTGYAEEAKKSAEGDEEKSSLLEVLADSLVGGAAAGSKSRTTRIAAYGVKDSKVMTVREDETVALPFGPPFKPLVKPSGSAEAGKTVSLRLSLVGSGGEQCSSLTVDGSRPGQPEFTIATGDGDEIESGKFKWG